jgi:hypothetical protein
MPTVGAPSLLSTSWRPRSGAILEQQAAWRDRNERAVGLPAKRKAAFVDEAVMKRAEQHQVLEARFATLGPVTKMVRLDEGPRAASWEPTATIARRKCPSERSARPASRATEIEERPARMLRDDLGVAGKPQQGCFGHASGSLQVRGRARAGPWVWVCNVHDDERTSFSVAPATHVGKEEPSHHCQGIGDVRAERVVGLGREQRLGLGCEQLLGLGREQLLGLGCRRPAGCVEANTAFVVASVLGLGHAIGASRPLALLRVACGWIGYGQAKGRRV